MTEKESSCKKPIPERFKGGRLLNAIIENENISGIGQAILFDITRFCDLGEQATFQEWIFRSKENLVRCTKFNEKAINKHIKILIANGYLLERDHKNKDGRNGPKEFRLTSKLFDEYLAPDNCQGLGGDNCQGLGGDNCQGLGGDNCHPNHNDSYHNKNEYNNFSPKPPSSDESESGENPQTPRKNKRVRFSPEEKEAKEIGYRIIVSQRISDNGYATTITDKTKDAIMLKLLSEFDIETLRLYEKWRATNTINQLKPNCALIKGDIDKMIHGTKNETFYND